jgi:hypothetical protein
MEKPSPKNQSPETSAPNAYRSLIEDLTSPYESTGIKQMKVITGLMEISKEIVRGTDFEKRFNEAERKIATRDVLSKDFQTFDNNLGTLLKCLEHVSGSDKAAAYLTFFVPGSDQNLYIHLYIDKNPHAEIKKRNIPYEDITPQDYIIVQKRFDNLVSNT